MTPKQQQFVDEYLVDLNATQAAIRAGYSAKTAYSTGHENLRKPEIATAVTEAQAGRAKRLEVTADRVIEEFAKLAFANIADYVAAGPDGLTHADLANMSPEQTAAIAEMSQTQKGAVRIKLHDKKAALDSLAKHLGLFTDKLEVTGKDGAPLNDPEDTVLAARKIAFLMALAEHSGSTNDISVNASDDLQSFYGSGNGT